MLLNADDRTCCLRRKDAMQTIDVAFVLTVCLIALFDLKTLRIPLVGLISIGVCCMYKGFSFQDLFYGFGLMIMSIFISDLVLRRETVGGGDLWLGMAISTYLGFDRFLTAYIIAAVLGTLAMMTVFREKRYLDIPYAPYIAVGTIGAMFI